MSFPDLTGDGKVTKKDILKGRGVEGFKKGGKVKMMRGGEIKFGHGCKVGGCNTNVQVSGLKNGADH